jgi:hypothetical protein
VTAARLAQLEREKAEEAAEHSRQLADQAAQHGRQLADQAAQHGRQLADWEAKVAAMEESLDLMRTEFESMEDYWQKKLEDERCFYEEQLRRNEDQFRDLEARMREYEVLLDNGGGFGVSGDDDVDAVGPSDAVVEVKKEEEMVVVKGRLEQRRREEEDDDKLSTIEESSSMEQQVTAWEEEINALRDQLEQLEESHAQQLERREAETVAQLEAAAEAHARRLAAAEADWRARMAALEARLLSAEHQSPPSQVVAKASAPTPTAGNVWSRGGGGQTTATGRNNDGGPRSLSHAPLSPLLSHISPRQARNYF